MPEEELYKSKRFIGVSEPEYSEQFDSEFLKKFAGDEWVETRTLNSKSSDWVPQGEIYISSGKPLKISEIAEDE